MAEQHASNEAVDITGKRFDPEKGEWVEDPTNSETSPLMETPTPKTEEAPGDALAEERATDDNENGTKGR